MDCAPISNYFINSSHNSYLTGHQVYSKSSADIYGKLLRKGLRCLEIDMWDGDKGQPIVTHGNTLCTKIPLIEVVQVIANNAFEEGNSCPVILSLEDHCSLEQQTCAANIFKAVLGDKLLLEPPQGTPSTALPTPKQLFGKIILKHKKLEDTEEEEPRMEEEEEAAAAESAIFTEDGSSGGFQKKATFKVKMNGVWQEVCMKLRGQELEIKSWSSKDDDAFFITEEAITFWHKGTRFHWPIEKTLNDSYSLFDDEFPSLADLVAFYQLNALPIHPHCKLAAPLVQPRELFRLQQWYYPHLDEQQTIQ